MQQIICPLSDDKVNNNVARIVATIVLLLTIVAVAFNFWWLLIIQLYDFTVRTINKRTLSPFRFVAQHIADLMQLPVVPVDEAPKRFAAGVGLVFTATIMVLMLLGHFVSAIIVAGILLVCALAEASIGFCVGCYVYTFMVLPFVGKETSNQI